MIVDGKKKKDVKSFQNLPPRVVIFKILVFHEVKIAEDTVGEFDLFGYFRLDRRRSIFYVFQSIFINFKNISKLPIIDFCKVHSFDFRNELMMDIVLPGAEEKISFMKKFVKNLLSIKNRELYSLRNIQFTGYWDIGYISDLFEADREVFTNLKGVSFSILEYENMDNFRMNKESRFLLFDQISRLNYKFLDWNHPPEVASESRFLYPLRNDDLPCLKKLEIKGIRYQKPRIIKVPLLESLKISKCGNLYLHPGSHLRNLKASAVRCETLKELFIRSKFLRKLVLKFGNVFIGEGCKLDEIFQQLWFTQRMDNPLEYLKYVSLRSFSNQDYFEKYESFLNGIVKRLESLKMRNCLIPRFNQHDSEQHDNIDSAVSETQTETAIVPLEELWVFSNTHGDDNDVSSVISLQSLLIQSSQAIRCLFLHGFDGLKSVFNDDFRPTNLESLILNSCSSSDFSEWRIMRFVKKLVLKVTHVTDEFFQFHDLENLTELVISEPRCDYDDGDVHSITEEIKSSGLTGDHWKTKKFMKLQKIVIYGNVLCDELFSSIEFPSLQRLKIRNCGSIKGENWLEMKDLKYLFLSCVDHFSEETKEKFRSDGVEVEELYNVVYID